MTERRVSLEVPECIQTLASTTFVQTVDGAALSIVVPLITRAFTEKSTAIKRLTAVIVENMSKLVDEPADAECFLGKVYEEVKSAAETMSNPEARSVCVRGLQNLDSLKNRMAANATTICSLRSESKSLTAPERVTLRRFVKRASARVMFSSRTGAG